MLFHLPRLSGVDLGLVRAPGPGLGNLLFPIARALVGARDEGGVLVRPTMRQIKLGPYLRREPDKRTYGDVLRHRGAAEWATWLRARRAPRLAETAPRLGSGDATRVYAGLGRYFHDIARDAPTVAAWLDGVARYDGRVDGPYDVAVHVRLGDFGAAGGGGANTRIPLAWYGAALDAAVRLIDARGPRIRLFSDGADDELGDLAARFPLERDRSRNALTAIRNISRARVVVASRSTFSMWGVFLGGTAAIWDAGFDRSPYLPDRPGLDHMI